MTCRRGNIRGSDVGAIRIESGYSLVDVARPLADTFEVAAGLPDPRNPKVRITRAEPSTDRRPAPPQRSSPGLHPEKSHRPPNGPRHRPGPPRASSAKAPPRRG
jgi:hypothetical protein